MKQVVLVKYGELNTKGKNRKLFIDKLLNNIKSGLAHLEDLKYTSSREHITIEFEEKNEQEIINVLKNIFGIQFFTIAYEVENNLDQITSTIMEKVSFEDYKTFKIMSKRSNKSFEYNSDQIIRHVATQILTNHDIKVDVRNPELEIRIELKQDLTYIFTKKIEGAKGYPVGVSGKSLLMISGGIDSPVAGYLMLKRGVILDVIHFASPPYTSQKALNKVLMLCEKLLAYTPGIRMHIVEFSQMQVEINKHCDETYSMPLMRRMMYRISERVANNTNCDVIVNGESIAQVASQTLKSMNVVNEAINIPVIRPLACYDKLEIIDIAKKIDTYETSILPYEDCCTIFLPAKPVINPKLDKVLKNESFFDYESLLESTYENIKTIMITKNTISEHLNLNDDDLF